MKNLILLPISFLILFSFSAFAQNEPFTRTVLNEKPGAGGYRLAHPFDIVYGPDDHLYITEKVGRILRVDTGTGVRQIILDIRSSVALNITRNGPPGYAATSIGQNGMLGLALHPGFSKGTGQDSIFVAYSSTSSNIRIVRYKYNGGASPSLTNPTILIQGIPAGGDHSTGRLIIGADNKLYYSCGDLGNNQFNNRCTEIRSQKLPTQTDIDNATYTLYSGKILRLNLDGSIPNDNPLWNGVQSHIYTIGHRNPQGLVWEKNPANGTTFPVLTPGGKLFSSEHGPNTDDEVNSIESGRNYGWPYIAGDTDEVNYQYVNWSSTSNCTINYDENPYQVPAGAVVTQEKNAPADVKANFRKPLVKAYTVCTPLPASQCELANGWLKFPTIAPSSIEYYNLNSGKGIPNWYPSLLVPTLRTGTLFRYRLNAAKDMIIGDSIQYFKTVNRYRDIALSPDGKIYIITDSIGSTSGPSGSSQTNMTNKGAILVFEYAGIILPIREHPENLPRKYTSSVYPNPATSYIQVETEPAVQKPIRYRLIDMNGKLILDEKTTRNNFTIETGRYRRGVYILKLFNGYGSEIRMDKIILQ
ncbi:T9SS C-terminal target domain-containing protein [Paraflavitalea soli]|uniref:T9SS C-terminal target domain-containing protein n=1 Tax=Paraflavitalea soli TaxID=2315862 RepID=A0A3B7MVB9_9BACT|nr:PQQ-dependent sugar dehydrogenase [Paraflavitalea soli]AXY77323.1 T9SS C-terminal target domain-containing protein [Paraflavitalea soli]